MSCLKSGFPDEDLCISKGNLRTGEVGPGRDVPSRVNVVPSYRRVLKTSGSGARELEYLYLLPVSHRSWGILESIQILESGE